jgi:hypothetical protein
VTGVKALMAKKRIKIIATFTFAILIVGVVYAFNSMPNVPRWNQGYPQIKAGDAKQRVVDLLGKPTEIRACQSPAWANVESCAEEYWYIAPLEEWIIAINKNGKVITKAHSVSP